VVFYKKGDYMMFKNTYWFWEAEIKPEVCDKWVNEHFNNNEIEEATVGTGKGDYIKNNDVRITDVVWIKPGTEIFDTIFNYVKSANMNAGWNFDLYGRCTIRKIFRWWIL
jgi:hypothetical protein